MPSLNESGSFVIVVAQTSLRHFNLIAPRKAKIVYNFGFSECKVNTAKPITISER